MLVRTAMGTSCSRTDERVWQVGQFSESNGGTCEKRATQYQRSNTTLAHWCLQCVTLLHATKKILTLFVGPVRYDRTGVRLDSGYNNFI
jgi:hypothetical protein